MKKLQKLIAAVLLGSIPAWAGLPPPTLKGQSDTNASVKFNLEVPYSQATSLGGVTSLIETGNKNLLQNASFENATYDTSWTHAGDVAHVETTSIEDGKKSIRLTYSGTGYLDQSVTPGVNTNSVNMEASCWVKTSAVTAEKVCALVGGTETNCQDVPSTGNWVQVASNFIGPSDGTTVGVKVKSDDGTSSGDVYVDDCYVGRARNLSQVSQAQAYGSLSLTGATNCSFSNNTSSETTFANLGTSTGCNAWSATGSMTAPTTNSISIPLNNAAPGAYKFVIHGMVFHQISGANQLCNLRLSDGTTNVPAGTVFSGASTSISYPDISGEFDYTTTGSHTINIQVATTSTEPCGIFANQLGRDVKVDVYYFPTQSQTAYKPDQTPASWSGYHTLSGDWAVTSTTFADFGAGTSVALTQTTARNMTCTSASGSLPGITCNFPRSGYYFACANFAANSSTNGQQQNYELVDGSGTVISSASANGSGASNSQNLCGIYSASSTSATTIKLKGASTSGEAQIVQPSATGSAAIQWNIVELDGLGGVYLTNQVSTPIAGGSNEAWATVSTVCTSDPCTIDSGSSGISAINWSSAGSYVVHFSAGVFSVKPTCTTATMNGGSGTRIAPYVGTATTSQVTLSALNAAGTQSNDNFTVRCSGPR